MELPFLAKHDEKAHRVKTLCQNGWTRHLDSQEAPCEYDQCDHDDWLLLCINTRKYAREHNPDDIHQAMVVKSMMMDARTGMAWKFVSELTCATVVKVDVDDGATAAHAKTPSRY